MMKTKVDWFSLFWVVLLGGFLLFAVGNIALEMYYIKTAPKKTYCFDVELVTGTHKTIQVVDYEGATFHILDNKGSYYLASLPPWWGHWSTVCSGVVDAKQISCK